MIVRLQKKGSLWLLFLPFGSGDDMDKTRKQDNDARTNQIKKALSIDPHYFHVLFHKANDAIFFHETLVEKGVPGRFIEVNEAACKMYGYSRQEFLTMSPMDVVVDSQKINVPNKDLLSNGSATFEVMHRHKDGTIIPAEISSHVFIHEEKQCTLSIIRDITRRKVLEEQLAHFSLHDSLTGLNNRAAFDQDIQELKGYAGPLGIMIGDVDGLKIINDTFGHSTGDNLLRSAASLIKQSLPAQARLYRLGGDEFAVIFLGMKESELERASRRIKANVEHHNQNSHKVALSISVGFSYVSTGACNIEKLIKEADTKMYREKLRANSSDNAAVKTFMKNLAVRDFHNLGHAKRLHILVSQFASLLNLSYDKRYKLCLLAQYHDIGKVAMEDAIIFKPGPLMGWEIHEMQRHSEIGYRIARTSSDLVSISEWILKHHEWWDGSGYPLGIQKEEIPLECRLFAISEAYEVMTGGPRPYRQSISPTSAISELKKGAGSQFDPQLVEKFINNLAPNRKIIRP